MSTEQDFLYQRKFAVSSDGDNNASQGDISAGGMYNKNTEWMQNSYTWVSLTLFPAMMLVCRTACVADTRV